MNRSCELEKMLSYMEQKYEEEFEFVEVYAGQLGKNYRMIVVENVKMPERKALVRLSYQGEKVCLEDNYLAILLREELEKEIGALAKECFGECEITYQLPQFVFSKEFQTDMKAQDFLKNPHAMSQFFFYPKEAEGTKEEWEKRLEMFRKIIADNGYIIKGTICLADADLMFAMKSSGTFRYMRWL